MLRFLTVLSYGLIVLAVFSSILGLAAALVQQMLILGILLLIGTFIFAGVNDEE